MDAFGNVIGEPQDVPVSGSRAVPFIFNVVGGTLFQQGTVVQVWYSVDEGGSSGAYSAGAPPGTLSSASASGSMEYWLTITT